MPSLAARHHAFFSSSPSCLLKQLSLRPYYVWQLRLAIENYRYRPGFLRTIPAWNPIFGVWYLAIDDKNSGFHVWLMCGGICGGGGVSQSPRFFVREANLGSSSNFLRQCKQTSRVPDFAIFVPGSSCNYLFLFLFSLLFFLSKFLTIPLCLKYKEKAKKKRKWDQKESIAWTAVQCTQIL